MNHLDKPVSRYWILCLIIVCPLSGCKTPEQTLLLDGGGLVAYNRIVDSLGTLPSTVAYFRGDWRENGHPYLWPHLEPSPGQYDFSPFLSALDEAQRRGKKIGFRLMSAHPFVGPNDPEHPPFFPSWIPFKSVTRDGRTAYAPDWDNPEVQRSIRNLLVELGKQTRDHPALLFVDIGVLGWVGEWHTTVGYRNSDFMPAVENQKRYVDFHIEAFGNEKLLLQLVDMDQEIISYGLSKGINGIRQDCFGSTYHMDLYDKLLEQIPELQHVIDTGMVFFEICGGNMTDWTHSKNDPHFVSLPIEEIMDRAIRWKCTMFANMGAPIPDRYLGHYMRLQKAMQGYIPQKFRPSSN